MYFDIGCTLGTIRPTLTVSKSSQNTSRINNITNFKPTNAMICRSCLRRASALRYIPQFARSLTSTSLRNAPTATPALESSTQQPPFTAPLTNLPNSKGVHAKSKPKSATELPVSITAAGTALTGINYIKGKPDPIALEESEYPEWLWRVLEGKPLEEGAENADGDEFGMCSHCHVQSLPCLGMETNHR